MASKFQFVCVESSKYRNPYFPGKIIKQKTCKVVFYYDKTSKTIADINGTKIQIHENLEGVKKQNLAIYAAALFEAYYDAVAKFDRDCRLDKQEDILWG